MAGKLAGSLHSVETGDFGNIWRLLVYLYSMTIVCSFYILCFCSFSVIYSDDYSMKELKDINVRF